jgi:crossover junction endodeoxyribonuclease RuvC
VSRVPCVLGVDPGFASLGYALLRLGTQTETLVAAGVVRTQASDKKRKVLAADDNARRCREIARDLVALFDEHTPLVICAESMSFPRNAATAAKMAMTWGALITIGHTRGAPIVQASPQEVKLALTRTKSASKEQVAAAVSKRYRNAPKLINVLPSTLHEHAYDAVASAVACLDSDAVRFLRGVVR